MQGWRCTQEVVVTPLEVPTELNIHDGVREGADVENWCEDAEADAKAVENAAQATQDNKVLKKSKGHQITFDPSQAAALFGFDPHK